MITSRKPNPSTAKTHLSHTKKMYIPHPKSTFPLIPRHTSPTHLYTCTIFLITPCPNEASLETKNHKNTYHRLLHHRSPRPPRHHLRPHRTQKLTRHNQHPHIPTKHQIRSTHQIRFRYDRLPSHRLRWQPIHDVPRHIRKSNLHRTRSSIPQQSTPRQSPQHHINPHRRLGHPRTPRPTRLRWTHDRANHRL